MLFHIWPSQFFADTHEPKRVTLLSTHEGFREFESAYQQPFPGSNLFHGFASAYLFFVWIWQLHYEESVQPLAQ